MMLIALCTAKEAAEKLDNSDEIGKHTSGPEGQVNFIAFMPGINPRPTFKTEFSAAFKARTRQVDPLSSGQATERDRERPIQWDGRISDRYPTTHGRRRE
jgi:hypothetical protein